MSEELTVSITNIPSCNEIVYSAHVEQSLLLKKLRHDVWFEVIERLTEKVSTHILLEHGESLVSKISEKESEVCAKITESLSRNLHHLIDRLNHFQRDYNAGTLCNCRTAHHPGTKICAPLGNLDYLEWKYDIIKQWVDSLKLNA